LIEGDRGAQIRLSKQEWNTEKLEKRIEMVPVSSHFFGLQMYFLLI
jgi:hypothetical protein